MVPLQYTMSAMAMRLCESTLCIESWIHLPHVQDPTAIGTDRASRAFEGEIDRRYSADDHAEDSC